MIVRIQIYSGKEICRKSLLVIIEESDAALVLVDGVLLSSDAPGVMKTSLLSLPLDEANPDGLSSGTLHRASLVLSGRPAPNV